MALRDQDVNGGKNILKGLFPAYISLEKEIQKRVSEIASPFCMKCLARCCVEEICRESAESPFLSSLIQYQTIQYDEKNGWLGPQGCRLAYGRSLICYDFFCDEILSDQHFQASGIRQVIKEFKLIGKRAYGNTHLIYVDNPALISPGKIAKMRDKLAELTSKLSEQAVALDRRLPSRDNRGLEAHLSSP